MSRDGGYLYTRCQLGGLRNKARPSPKLPGLCKQQQIVTMLQHATTGKLNRSLYWRACLPLDQEQRVEWPVP